MEQLMTLLMALVGGGGFVAIVQIFAGKHKTKYEKTDFHVQTTMKLEQIAIERYNDVLKNLDAAERYLTEARKEADFLKNYVRALEDLLAKHDIPMPEKPERTV